MTEIELLFIKSFVVVLILIIIKLGANRAVNNILLRIDFDTKRKRITHRIINLFLMLTLTTVLAAIWNIDRTDLIVFLTSVATVLGIAFFAQWSILSNITASLILFFNHPLKIGNYIRVMDKEFDVEGELQDVSFFFLYIKTNEGALITIPTSVVLNKTIQTKINNSKKIKQQDNK
ncbi:MAG: mechanosensitive ion channel [Bacteroidetes bacterium]|nr:mechanosensitive ion channel [Bacteroidota bacterium]